MSTSYESESYATGAVVVRRRTVDGGTPVVQVDLYFEPTPAGVGRRPGDPAELVNIGAEITEAWASQEITHKPVRIQSTGTLSAALVVACAKRAIARFAERQRPARGLAFRQFFARQHGGSLLARKVELALAQAQRGRPTGAIVP
ncbi:MAG: hypothetical protein IT377_27810 [Polyangiaceae bacterium]|nr:hypothetical protein [Polyangiaceae bacterium]